MAIVVDAVFGDPAILYRHIPHPVALLGRLIERLENTLNPARSALNDDKYQALLRGGVVAIFVISLAAGVGELIAILSDRLVLGFLLEILAGSTLIAGRGLYQHVRTVALTLERDPEAARTAVSHLVGRDPHSLDAPGIARAAIESAAENFVDAVVAPILWWIILGLPGLFAYKAINTLDSMLGHRSVRYRDFGKLSARIDDLANWLPARCGALFFVAASLFIPQASVSGAWKSVWRFAHLHRSVNAGWPEAAMAGALGFALAGPRQYAAGKVDDAWIGDGRTTLNAADIHASLRLYCTAWFLLLVWVGWIGWLMCG